MKKLHVVSYILVIVGALNWGLIGLFNFDLVAAIFGDMTLVSRVVYSLVGISAVSNPVNHKKECKECCSMSSGTCGCGSDKKEEQTTA